MVPFGLVTAWRLAGSPTRVSPLLVNATTEGVSRLPSWLAMTVASPPSMTATTLLVVPRSIPMIFSPSATVNLLSVLQLVDGDVMDLLIPARRTGPGGTGGLSNSGHR